jgi:hypothetical protein
MGDEEPQTNGGPLRRVLGDLALRAPKEDAPKCGGCRRRPFQIPEYVEAATAELGSDPDPTPEEIDAWLRVSEGTFNPATNRYLCTECFLRAGMPVSPQGWKCP